MFDLLRAAIAGRTAADGSIQGELAGMAHRLQDHGGAGQATKLQHHAAKHALDTAGQVDATIHDLEAVGRDQATIKRAGIDPREIGKTIHELRALRQRLMQHASAGGPAPSAAVTESLSLFAEYRKQSQLALDAIYHSGFADFVDDFRLDGKVRPDDAADALLRLNTAVYSVYDDLRQGKLRPADFGKSSWEQVDARAMYELAVERLDNGKLDFGQKVTAMEHDPSWRQQPVMIRRPGEAAVELKPGNYDGFWHRGVDSVANAAGWARGFEQLAFARQMGQDAAAVADHKLSDTAATIETAYNLYKGRGVAPDASQTLAALVDCTGIEIYSKFTRVPAGTTPAKLQEQQRKGLIDGFVPLPGGGFASFKLKSIPEIAAEIRSRLHSGQLDYLPDKTRHQIVELTGGDRPGADLLARINAEDSGRAWRQFASDVVMTAAVGIISGGVGTLAEGAALTLRAGRVGVASARLLAASATFTTVMGAAKGKLTPQQYAMDLAMFGALSAAGPFVKLAEKVMPGGQVAKLIGAHAVSMSSSAAVMTAFGLHGRERPPGWPEVVKEFAANLAMVGALHGVNQGLIKLGEVIETRRQVRESVRQEYYQQVANETKLNLEINDTLQRLHQLALEIDGIEARRTAAKVHNDQDTLRDTKDPLKKRYVESQRLMERVKSLKVQIHDGRMKMLELANEVLPPAEAKEFAARYVPSTYDELRVAEIRRHYNLPPADNHNVAVADIDIAGIKEKTLISISGDDNFPGTVGIHSEKTFKVLPEGKNPRDTDTEYKILNDLVVRLKLKPGMKGSIRLYSERCPCPSCTSVIRQFERTYGIKVEVTYTSVKRPKSSPHA